MERHESQTEREGASKKRWTEGGGGMEGQG